MAERKTYTAEDFKGCNGRRVLVEGVIDDSDPVAGSDLRIIIPRLIGGVMLPKSAIVEILPEEITVGDRVKWCGEMGRILHIDGDVAWLRTDYGQNFIPNLSDLTLVERGQ